MSKLLCSYLRDGYTGPMQDLPRETTKAIAKIHLNSAPRATETTMSTFAKDLLELVALPTPHGSLTAHLLRELALNIIAPGVADEREGC